MADEIQNLILKIQGQDELAILNKQLDNETLILKQLASDLRQGNISQSQFDAGAKAMAGSIIGLNQQMAQLNVGAKGLANPQSLLGLSYIFDDLANTTGGWERKLASISNNIPGLIMSLGKEGLQGKIAALAGPIGLVATALIALAPLAKAAWDSMSSSVPKERLDEIADAARKVKDELDKLRESQSSEDAATQKGFEEMFAGEGKQIQGSIASALTATGRGEHMTADEARIGGQTDAEIDAQVAADVRSQGAAGQQWAAQQRAQLRALRDRSRTAAIDRINAANVERAGTLLGKAPTDKGARDTIYALAHAAPGNFRAGFAGDLESMEPDVMAQRDAEAAAFDETNNAYSERARNRREAASRKKHADAEAERKKAADDRLVDQLNHQGTAVENEMRNAELKEGQQAQRDLSRQTAQRQRRGPVDEYARQMWDFNQQNRTGLGDSQIQAAAAQAVQMVNAGADVNDAMMAAFANQIQEMQRLRFRLQQQAGRARGLMMGGDQSGNFSQLPPSFGG